MIRLRKPQSADIRAFADAQRSRPLTYEAVGATAGEPPAGYVVDHTRVRLGAGPDVFESARAALRNWSQFEIGWLEAWPSGATIREGEVVAIVARSLGMWWLNACRVVDVLDDERRFGYAYGTLPDHAGSGEERFLVEQDEEGDVWYDVLAFSKARHPLAKLGYPFLRHVQRRFGPASAVAMSRAIASRE